MPHYSKPTKGAGMAEAFFGEIRLVAFSYAPEGWLMCEGQTLLVTQYQALYALLGTTYGGTAGVNFKLPDLRGRVAIHAGQGPTNVVYPFGASGGTNPTVINTIGATTIQANNLPQHTHTATFTPTGGGAATQPTITLKVSNDPATSPTPVADGYLAGMKVGIGTPPSAYVGTATSGTTSLNTNAAVASGGSGGITGGSVTVAPAGSPQPVALQMPVSVSVPPVMPPFVALNYMICTSGLWPSRP
jgi:microcystin-dependent protein